MGVGSLSAFFEGVQLHLQSLDQTLLLQGSIAQFFDRLSHRVIGLGDAIC